MQFYNLKDVRVYVGSVRLRGYAPNDAIGVQWHDDLYTVDTTADGDKIASRNNDDGLDIMFSLMNTSDSYTLLAGLMQTQLDSLSSIPPLRFRLNDPAIGDLISSNYLLFRNRPAMQKNKQASVVQFRCMLPRPRIVYGANNRRLIA